MNVYIGGGMDEKMDLSVLNPLVDLEAQGHTVGWALWNGAEGLGLWRSPTAGHRSKGSPEDVQAK